MRKKIAALFFSIPALTLLIFQPQGNLENRHLASNDLPYPCLRLFEKKDDLASLCAQCEFGVLTSGIWPLLYALGHIDGIPESEIIRTTRPDPTGLKQVLTVISGRDLRIKIEEQSIIESLIREIRNVPFGKRLLSSATGSDSIRWDDGRTLVTLSYVSDKKAMGLLDSMPMLVPSTAKTPLGKVFSERRRLFEIDRSTTRSFYGFAYSDGASSVIALDHFQSYAEGILSLVHELFHLRDALHENGEGLTDLEKKFGSELRAYLAEAIFYKEWKELRKNCNPQISKKHEEWLEPSGRISIGKVITHTAKTFFHPVGENGVWEMIPDKLTVLLVPHGNPSDAERILLNQEKEGPLKQTSSPPAIKRGFVENLATRLGLKGTPVPEEIPRSGGKAKSTDKNLPQIIMKEILALLELGMNHGQGRVQPYHKDRGSADIVVRAYHRYRSQDSYEVTLSKLEGRRKLVELFTQRFENDPDLFAKWNLLPLRQTGLNKFSEGGPKTRDDGDGR